MNRTANLALVLTVGLSGCTYLATFTLDGTPQNPHTYQGDLPNPWPIDTAAKVMQHDRDPGDGTGGPDLSGSSGGGSSGGSGSGGSSSGGSGSGGSSSGGDGGDGGDGCEPEKDKGNNGYGNGGDDGSPNGKDDSDR